MPRNYDEYANERLESLKLVHDALPKEVKEFRELAAATTRPGALSSKTKELIAAALAVANGCTDCITFHSKACVKLGATEEEFMEALGVAIYMGGGPGFMRTAEAYDAFRQFKKLLG